MKTLFFVSFSLFSFFFGGCTSTAENFALSPVSSTFKIILAPLDRYNASHKDDPKVRRAEQDDFHAAWGELLIIDNKDGTLFVTGVSFQHQERCRLVIPASSRYEFILDVSEFGGYGAKFTITDGNRRIEKVWQSRNPPYQDGSMSDYFHPQTWEVRDGNLYERD